MAGIAATLQSIQDTLLARAEAFRREHTREISSMEELTSFFAPKNADKPEIHGGFAIGHWAGSAEDEATLTCGGLVLADFGVAKHDIEP